jgi:predicted TIM-barrel fold metal-dependent hydrolase
VVTTLGWDSPGSPEDLADRWIQDLDRNGINRAALIASVPGDEESVARAVARHPQRFVGFFMLDPTAADAQPRAERAFASGLRTMCLFPAMHRYALHDPHVTDIVALAARHDGAAVFVHCGALSVGVRKKLGLPSRFDVRHGNPLDLQHLAADHPRLPFVIPHFGAGLFREALLVADLCANVYFDTSSTNRWVAYHPSLDLVAVFRQALAVAGPDRLLFGTDSSFFPRGWNREIRDTQLAALDKVGVDEAVRQRILGGNFDRLFPSQP